MKNNEEKNVPYKARFTLTIETYGDNAKGTRIISNQEGEMNQYTIIGALIEALKQYKNMTSKSSAIKTN